MSQQQRDPDERQGGGITILQIIVTNGIMSRSLNRRPSRSPIPMPVTVFPALPTPTPPSEDERSAFNPPWCGGYTIMSTSRSKGLNPPWLRRGRPPVQF